MERPKIPVKEGLNAVRENIRPLLIATAITLANGAFLNDYVNQRQLNEVQSRAINQLIEEQLATDALLCEQGNLWAMVIGMPQTDCDAAIEQEANRFRKAVGGR